MNKPVKKNAPAPRQQPRVYLPEATVKALLKYVSAVKSALLR